MPLKVVGNKNFSKVSRSNTGTKLRFRGSELDSIENILSVFETKTKFSRSGKNRLQDAINDSAKAHLRIDESLNFIKLIQ
jgi:hypothetical protein